MRSMYLVLAPGHPRGRTDMHAVVESADASTLWVHTHGLTKLELREIELVGVPISLRGYAHGILFDIMGYMGREKPIEPDEHFGGLLVSAEQRVAHYATARQVDRPDDEEHDGFLRFVDYDCSVDSGFPPRLFAAHIVALAEQERSPRTRERLARLSLEVYEGSPSDWMREAAMDRNPGNWLAFEVLGHALYDQGDAEAGERCFTKLIERCPAAAARLHEIYSDAIAAGELPPPDADARSRFWSSVDPVALREAVAARERGL